MDEYDPERPFSEVVREMNRKLAEENSRPAIIEDDHRKGVRCDRPVRRDALSTADLSPGLTVTMHCKGDACDWGTVVWVDAAEGRLYYRLWDAIDAAASLADLGLQPYDTGSWNATNYVTRRTA